jgi:hypothetical protein
VRKSRAPRTRDLENAKIATVGRLCGWSLGRPGEGGGGPKRCGQHESDPARLPPGCSLWRSKNLVEFGQPVADASSAQPHARGRSAGRKLPPERVF